MIFDCFPFFNELEILDIRLHELDPWVDYFVLVESRETFSGNNKELIFEKNKYLFEPFLDKIIHLISPISKNPKDAWDRQIQQRDYALKALSNCNDDDLILVGDLDEIPNGQDFISMQKGRDYLVSFIQKNYIYYINLRRSGGWPGTVMIPYKTLMSRYKGSLFKVRMRRRKGGKILGGWHFSNLGGIDAVRLKMESSGHHAASFTREVLETPGALYDKMEVSRVVKGKKLRAEPIDFHPVYFRDNIEKFKHLMTEVPMPGILQNKAIRRQAYVNRVKWATALLKKLVPSGKAVGVEVGLWKGDFAFSMLQENPKLTWYGVDPYFEYGRKKRKQPAWDAIYERVRKKLDQYSSRCIMVRKPSSEGVKDIPNNVDFVFIDGNHDYEYVLKDIKLYEKKIRKGGVLAGHDYYGDGVSKAANEYAKKHKRKMVIEDSFDVHKIFWWKVP